MLPWKFKLGFFYNPYVKPSAAAHRCWLNNIA
jgi:hypothetical protein